MAIVFLTGATGYIGQRLALRLGERGHGVRALARAGSEHRVPPGCTPVIGDALHGASYAGQIQPADRRPQAAGRVVRRQKLVQADRLEANLLAIGPPQPRRLGRARRGRGSRGCGRGRGQVGSASGSRLVSVIITSIYHNVIARVRGILSQARRERPGEQAGAVLRVFPY